MSVEKQLAELRLRGKDDRTQESGVMSDDLQKACHQEFIQARRRQKILFDELKETGVIGIVQQVTQGPIFWIDYELRGNKLHRIKSEESEKPSQIKVSRLRWQADVVLPRVSSKGSWDTALYIYLTNKAFRPAGASMYELGSACVVVAYGHARSLAILGKDSTYRGAIPGDEVEKTDLIEQALAQAIDQPWESFPRLPIPSFRNGQLVLK
ncbi:hypothetical protein HY389_02500 [Candidatus Daviesbacteria bacterium]|nr:hypothetical protein [Candidatus Daviesbacteria bacterium]